MQAVEFEFTVTDSFTNDDPSLFNGKVIDNNLGFNEINLKTNNNYIIQLNNE